MLSPAARTFRLRFWDRSSGEKFRSHDFDSPMRDNSRATGTSARDATVRTVFYGWWIVLAAFLNLFFAVGLVFYGLPVFYTSLVDSLHFSRSQVAQGMFLGYLLVAPAFGFMGALIDRLGARPILRAGALLVALALVLMAGMTHLWQYYILCVLGVVGYVLVGPISNQVLVSNWFRAKRGRAMGYAYLGLGFGGVVAPVLAAYLIRWLGWRHAFATIGILIAVVLFPVNQWLTRSTSGEMGLAPDGAESEATTTANLPPAFSLGAAVRTANFWLILVGSSLTIGAIGTVIQQFVLFLRDQG